MIPRFTIASSQAAITNQYGSHPALSCPIYLTDGQGYPVLTSESYRTSWKLVDFDPLNPFVQLTEIFSNKRIRQGVVNDPVIIPVNCYFVRDGAKVKLVRSLKSRILSMAGFIDRRNETEHVKMLCVKSNDILADYTSIMPLALEGDEWRNFLFEMDLQQLCEAGDHCGNDWLDIFDVDPRIATSKVNSKNLLKPLQPGNYKKMDEIKKELMHFKSRANRRSGK